LNPTEFRRRSHFSSEDIVSLSEGSLVEGQPAILPRSLLLPFHEIRKIEWDESSGKGRLEAVRRNRFDDWFYACHFLSDPVMPGCWALDGVWQSLRLFAAWFGLPDCDKPLGSAKLSFFGQIRPHDREIVYALDGISLHREDGEAWVAGNAVVKVDGQPVYNIADARIGTAFWEADGASAPAASPASAAEPFLRKLSWKEFRGRSAFSHPEIVALSRGVLVEDPPKELGLLPDSLMLEIHEIHRIAFDPKTGEGEIIASRRNDPTDWFFPMNGGVKPAALLVDAVWQTLGVFLSWTGRIGTGRALGYERTESFGAVGPRDRRLLYRVRILKLAETPSSGEPIVRADAEVFADGRKVLSMSNACVGLHKNIRYDGYPGVNEMSFGGKLKVRN
jgi:3-hydroxyacyl-[acyl-carrier protein] dehydratase/trans-2-decenoyl-[acyl-carrier protein] isomerase